jgi:hypothetical protein
LSYVVPKRSTPLGRSMPSPVSRACAALFVGRGDGDGVGDGTSVGEGEGEGLGEGDGDVDGDGVGADAPPEQPLRAAARRTTIRPVRRIPGR